MQCMAVHWSSTQQDWQLLTTYASQCSLPKVPPMEQEKRRPVGNPQNSNEDEDENETDNVKWEVLPSGWLVK